MGSGTILEKLEAFILRMNISRRMRAGIRAMNGANNGRSWTLDSMRGTPAVWIGIPVATGTSISPREHGVEPNQKDSPVDKAMSSPDEWLFKPFPRNRGNNPSKYRGENRDEDPN